MPYYWVAFNGTLLVNASGLLRTAISVTRWHHAASHMARKWLEVIGFAAFKWWSKVLFSCDSVVCSAGFSLQRLRNYHCPGLAHLAPQLLHSKETTMTSLKCGILVSSILVSPWDNERNLALMQCKHPYGSLCKTSMQEELSWLMVFCLSQIMEPCTGTALPIAHILVAAHAQTLKRKRLVCVIDGICSCTIL